MEHEARDAEPRPPHLQPPASPPGGGQSEGPELERLPPPFFPGGATGRRSSPASGRRVAARENGRPGMETEEGGVPADAFIDPDEPIRPIRARFSDDAFIDPDEPIVRTRSPSKPSDFEEVLGGSEEGEGAPEGSGEGGSRSEGEGLGLEEFGDMDVVVTGIGDDAHLDDEDLSDVERYGDPHVADLVGKVGALADALRDRGEAGLRSAPGMSRFEATLRAYCVGYLAGRRTGEE